MKCIYKVGDCVTVKANYYTYFIITDINSPRVTVHTFFRTGEFRYRDHWSLEFINSCIKYDPKIVAKRCKIG